MRLARRSLFAVPTALTAVLFAASYGVWLLAPGTLEARAFPRSTALRSGPGPEAVIVDSSSRSSAAVAGPTGGVADVSSSHPTSGPSGGEDTRVTITASEAKLQTLLEALSRQSRREIRFEGEVERTLCVDLRGVPWRVALETIAALAGCRIHEEDGVFVLTPATKVTLQFSSADVQTILALLGSYAGKTLHVAPTVTGHLTLDLKDVDWDLALLAIMSQFGLHASIDTQGDVWVDPEGYAPMPDAEVLQVSETLADLPALPAEREGEQGRSERVTLLYERGVALGVVVEALVRQCGQPIFVLDPGLYQEWVEVSVRDVHWSVALKRVAGYIGARVEQRGDLLVVAPGERVTVDFTGAGSTLVLQLIAAYTGRNLVIDPGQHRSVSVDLDEVPWEVAIRVVAQAAGSRAWRQGRVIVVTSADRPRPAGAEPLVAPVLWTAPTPEARVDLEGRLSTQRACTEVGLQAFRRVRLAGDVDFTSEWALEGVRWQDAAREIARRAGLQIVWTAEGAWIGPHERREAIHAYDAPVHDWLLLLAARQGESVALGDGIRGAVSGRYLGEPASILRESLKALSATASVEGDVLCLSSPRELDPPLAYEETWTPQPTFALGGKTYGLPALHAVVLHPVFPSALISGYRYSQGLKLVDPISEEEGDLTLTRIEAGRVRVVQEGTGAAAWLEARLTSEGWRTVALVDQGRAD